jgi:hypothetical protein
MKVHESVSYRSRVDNAEKIRTFMGLREAKGQRPSRESEARQKLTALARSRLVTELACT